MTQRYSREKTDAGTFCPTCTIASDGGFLDATNDLADCYYYSDGE